jgi:hypothetical protein
MLTVNKLDCIEATVMTIFGGHYQFFGKDQCVDGVYVFEVRVGLEEVCDFFERLFRAFPRKSITYFENPRTGDTLSHLNIEVGIRFR